MDKKGLNEYLPTRDRIAELEELIRLAKEHDFTGLAATFTEELEHEKQFRHFANSEALAGS